MNPKRLMRVMLLLAIVAGVGAAGWVAVVSSVGGRIARCVGGETLDRVARNVVQTASAEEALKFKPVPAESAGAFERRTRARSVPPAAVTPDAVPPENAAPTEPIPPTPPAAPGTPEGSIPSRSGNITRLGSDIVVAPDQVVVGDVVSLGGDVRVSGHVQGDVASMGGDVYLASTAHVDGDVVCMGGKLHEEPGATVGGQRVTGLGHRGEFYRREREEHAIVHSAHLAGSLTWLFIMVVVAWAFSSLGPGRTAAAAETLKRETWLSLGIGALVFALIIPSFIALALVFAILCITIIGIPVALAAMLAYCLTLGLAWVWGYVVAVVVVGGWALERRAQHMAPGTPVVEPSLARRAFIGVLIVSGSGFAGMVLRTMGFVSPLRGIGMFISVCSIIAAGLAATMGSGAWLRTEIKAGTVARWWRGSQWGRGSGPVPPAGTPAPPAAPMPPMPPAPPAAPIQPEPPLA